MHISNRTAVSQDTVAVDYSVLTHRGTQCENSRIPKFIPTTYERFPHVLSALLSCTPPCRFALPPTGRRQLLFCCFAQGCKTTKSVSILLRGPSEHMLDEVERSLHDALCVIKVSCRNPVSFTVCTLLLMLIIANLPPCLWVRPSFHGIVELRRGSLVEDT